MIDGAKHEIEGVRVLRDHFFERYRDRDRSRFLKLNDTDTESGLAF